MVLSVSKTYLRLKDLILEKKFLQKETKKLKNLNTHLETRLDEQEQRLTTVTIELNKTWTLVGRMQRQHRQLHTSEQVLRYQLQQKRRMLNELKDELEYCRRKWTLAKEKNSETQSQWNELRQEFIRRKECDANNSAESGYSDSPLTDDDDEGLHGDGGKNGKAADGELTKSKRVQSLSPVRRSKLHVARRNSDSHVAQFTAEVIQLQSDEVQPICATCDGCDANCAIHSVHFDDRPKIDQIKVTEAIVLDAAQPTVESQQCAGTSSKTKGVTVGQSTRKVAARALKKGTEESLEAMFMRIAGLEPETVPCEQDSFGEEGVETEQYRDEIDTITVDSTHEADNIAADARTADMILLPPDQDDPQPSTSDAKTYHTENMPSNEHNTIESVSNEIDPKTSRIDLKASEIEPSSSECGSSEQQPSTSTGQTVIGSDDALLTATEIAYTERRSDRLKRLEDESNAFLEKMRHNNDRASQMQNKLQLLHERYGSEKKASNTETDSSEKSEENVVEEHTEETPAEPADNSASDHNENTEH